MVQRDGKGITEEKRREVRKRDGPWAFKGGSLFSHLAQATQGLVVPCDLGKDGGISFRGGEGMIWYGLITRRPELGLFCLGRLQFDRVAHAKHLTLLALSTFDGEKLFYRPQQPFQIAECRPVKRNTIPSISVSAKPT